MEVGNPTIEQKGAMPESEIAYSDETFSIFANESEAQISTTPWAQFGRLPKTQVWDDERTLLTDGHQTFAESSNATAMDGDCPSEERSVCTAAGNYMIHLWKEQKAFGSASSPQSFKSYFSSANLDVDSMFRCASIRNAIHHTDSCQEEILGSQARFPHIPRMYISEEGSLGILLSHHIVVEVSLGSSVRICQMGACAISVNEDNRLAAIHHPTGEFLLNDGFMYANFSHGPRIRMLPDGIRIRPCLQTQLFDSQFSCRNNCYWNLNNEGLFWEEIGPMEDDSLDPFGDFPFNDQSVPVFLSNLSQTEDRDIFSFINRARVVPSFSRQTVSIWIGNMKIKQNLRNGDTQVQKYRSVLSLRPDANEVSVKTENAKMYVGGWDRVLLENGPSQKIFTLTSTTLTARHAPSKAARFDLWGRLRSLDGFQVASDSEA